MSSKFEKSRPSGAGFFYPEISVFVIDPALPGLYVYNVSYRFNAIVFGGVPPVTAHPYNKCYELKGRSLAAAQRLYAEVGAAAQREQPKNSGTMGDIQKSWQDFYLRLLTRLQQEQPDLLQATGLDKPVVKVQQDPGMFSRAYETYPHIFLSPERKPRFFMYVPVGHDGDHFVPQDAVLHTGAAERNIGSLLFAGGWLGNAPIFDRVERGVALPHGIAVRNAAAAESTPGFGNLTEYACLARGTSLSAIVDYEQRMAVYDTQLSAAMAAVKTAVEATFPQLAKAYPHLDGFYVNMSARYGTAAGSKPAINFSVRVAGGAPVPAVAGSAFTPVVVDMNEYEIVPRTDTPEGRALDAVLQSVPVARPSIEDYPALRLNGLWPQISTHGAYKILRYFGPADIASARPPADTQPFDTAALRWLLNDDTDRRRGVQPPPQSPELSALLSVQLGRHDSPASRRAKGPKPL